MSASNIVNSFYGHMYNNSKPKNVFNNIDKAVKEGKSINLTSGRFVQNKKYSTYWYYHLYPFAIPIELAIDQNEANCIFDTYVQKSARENIFITESTNTDSNMKIDTDEYDIEYMDSTDDDSYESDFIDDSNEIEYMDGDTDYVDE